MKKEIKPFFCTYCDKQVPCGCDKKFHLQEPIKEDWEKEFNKEFDNLVMAEIKGKLWRFKDCTLKGRTKTFISKLLEAEKQQYRQEILDRLPKEKELENENIAGLTNARTRNDQKTGYNQALQEIKELINKDE
jgi:hypothetical protein